MLPLHASSFGAASRAARAVLLALLLAAAPAADAARAPKPPLCPPGRYVVAGEALIPGATPPLEVVEIAEAPADALKPAVRAIGGLETNLARAVELRRVRVARPLAAPTIPEGCFRDPLG
jgi:hypothetical protein